MKMTRIVLPLLLLTTGAWAQMTEISAGPSAGYSSGSLFGLNYGLGAQARFKSGDTDAVKLKLDLGSSGYDGRVGMFGNLKTFRDEHMRKSVFYCGLNLSSSSNPYMNRYFSFGAEVGKTAKNSSIAVGFNPLGAAREKITKPVTDAGGRSFIDHASLTIYPNGWINMEHALDSKENLFLFANFDWTAVSKRSKATYTDAAGQEQSFGVRGKGSITSLQLGLRARVGQKFIVKAACVYDGADLKQTGTANNGKTKIDQATKLDSYGFRATVAYKIR